MLFYDEYTAHPDLLAAFKGYPIKLAANILTAAVALIHIGILMLEMFFWNRIGQRIFANES